MTGSPTERPERARGSRRTLTLGIRCSRTTDIVRIAAAAGYDAILIDMEHSSIPLDVVTAMCATAIDLGIFPVVRPPERDYGIIGRLLDGGACGILAPRIDTVEEAEAVVHAARFAPRGHRSQTGMVPHNRMRPVPPAQLNPQLDAATIVQVQIETLLGVANADAIAAVPGVDALVIGANDLCTELGVPGDFHDPRIEDAVKTVAAACRASGKRASVGGVSDPALLKHLRSLGDFSNSHLVGFDLDLLYDIAMQRRQKVEENFPA